MNHLTIAFALCAACLTDAAHAASHMKEEAPKPAAGASAPLGKQQSKMADCNRLAIDHKGDDRKAFMKTCLSSRKASQQDKMKSCNADPKAVATKGEERKAFMKECLSAA